MNTRQKSIIGELLTGIDLTWREAITSPNTLRELALCLRTATTYTEGLLALETEGALPVATLAPAGPPAAAFQEALFDHFAAPPPPTWVILPDETNLHGFPEGVLVLRVCHAGQLARVVKTLRACVRDYSCENSTGGHPSALGLKEAKTIVESAPIILADAGPHTEELVRSLQAAGATVDVVPRVNGNHHLDHASEVYAHFAELALRSGGAS